MIIKSFAFEISGEQKVQQEHYQYLKIMAITA